MSANFQKIIDKISEAFSFFDFSFLISGSATFAICCYTLNQLGINISSDNMFLNVCISIVGVYIAGLKGNPHESEISINFKFLCIQS